MKNFLITISLFLLGICPSFPQNQQGRRPMTLDDALNMVTAGDVLMTPDGQWVFFSKSELDWKNNKRVKHYYICPSGGAEARQFIGEASGSSFQFSPDGAYLSFKRRAGEQMQIFIMNMGGGEASQLTNHKTGIDTYTWSADSGRIYFKAADAKSEEAEKRFKSGYDEIFVDEDANGQNHGAWDNIWSFDLKTRGEKQITKEKFIVDEFAVSPDGRKIAVVARYTNRRNDKGKNEIYLLDTGSGGLERLTANEVPEEKLAWAPDGKSFAFMAGDEKRWLNRNLKIYFMNPLTKAVRLVSANLREGTIRDDLTWAPNSEYIVFTALVHTNFHLFRVNVATGEIRQLTSQTGSLRAQSLSKDLKKMVYSFSDFETPEDLYVSEVESLKPTRITDLNPWVRTDLQMASMKIMKWKSEKGFEIEGLLHLPQGYKQGERLPLILNIHGGPSGFFANSFNALYHVYAGLGYASLSPNVRGSMGYTDAFREGNTFYTGDGIGKSDYWDLMNGVDYVIEAGYANPDMLALSGHSYGAILGSFTITQTNRFKAAVLGDGVYDWSAEYGPGWNWDVRLWHIGGTPWDNPGPWRQQSTITHVKNISTPTFLFHGMEDSETRESNSMALFTALKDIGKVPVRYIRVPRENHFPSEPHHLRTYYTEAIRWLQKYVRGIDWQPWEREEKETKSQETPEGVVPPIN